MARDTGKRIDTVPTPRASDVDEAVEETVGASSAPRMSATASAATPSEAGARTAVKPRRGPAARGLATGARPVVEVPHQASAPSPLVATPAAPPVRRHRVRRAVWIAVAATVVAALGSGSAVYATETDDLTAKNALLAASLRVDGAVLASSRDTSVDENADAAAAAAALTASRARTAAQALAVVDQANAVLAATPNAGDAPRAALASAATVVAATRVAPGTSAESLRKLSAGVAGPQQAAVDAQAAWQVAEDARIAAEQAAAAAAAAQAQAAAAAAAAKKKSAAPRAPRAPRTTSAGAAAAPAAAAPAAAPSGVPAGGKVCSGSGGSGAGASGAGAIGAAINAYRAGLGLPELSVSTSGSLTSHAIDMANTGGIWHSGSDNIVACVSNGSASTMVSAWSQSPGHDAQMRRTDVSSMAVGGAGLNGWLFGAVKFN